MGGRHWVALFGLGLVFAAGGMAGAGAAPTGPAARVAQLAPPASLRDGNLLANPGFEDGFSLQGAAELVVADGWVPWYDETQVRPEFKDEPYVRYRPDGGVQSFSLRVLHGVTLQKFFTFSGTHDAGIYQQVQVTPGDRLRFSVWVETWSSDCDDPCISPLERCRVDSTNSHGTYRVQAGIDPTGATPDRLGALPPGTVQWSDPPIVFEAYDRWFRLELEAVAQSSTVTVYTRGHPAWPVKHNDSYWDDARLERADTGGPTPSPTVASTAGPTATFSSSPTPRTPTPHTQVPPTPASRAFLPFAVKDHDLGATPGPTVTPPIGSPPTSTPTETPEPPPSPTMVPEPTLAPTGAPSPTPGDGARCVRPVTNGDFETGDLAGWTAGPAGPAMPEVSSADVGPGGGDHSLRVGISAPLRDLGPSWSWAAQALDVPADVLTATLRFAVRPESADTDGGDWQMVAVRYEDGTPLALVYWHPGRSVASWQTLDVALDPRAVAGRRIRVLAEAYNDGDGAPTALYVDNVRLEACRPAPALGLGAMVPSARDPVPPGADIRIEFPIRYSPAQPNFDQATCSDLEFEAVVVANAGGVPVSVGGWTLDDRDGNRYVFPPFVLGPGDRVRVWTKSGADTTDGHFTDVYWNRVEPVWNNGGTSTPWDEAVLRDDAGTEVARRGYP